MASLAPLFLVWKGPPLDKPVLEQALADKGFAGVTSRPWGGLSTAQLWAPDKVVHQLLQDSGEFVVAGYSAYVTSSDPTVAPLPTSLSEDTRVTSYDFPRVASVLSPRKRLANVFKVCVTGGPCAGKTTVLSTIISRFSSKGIPTYAVPEAATTLINGGLSFADMTPKKQFQYQKILLQTQLELEQRFVDIATADEVPALVVCDRGAMDGKAYCDDDVWNAIMAELSYDIVQLRDLQYDAVYHMVTAAKGAEEFYGDATNKARMETPEQARALDDKTMSVYLGHPHLRIIDNSTDFARKVERVVKAIAEDMGVEVPTSGNYRRFLVKSPPPQHLPVPTVMIGIIIYILQSSDPETELRLLARGQDDRWSYFLQELRTVGGMPLLTEKRISYSEYEDRQKQVDQRTEMIQKSSLSFTYNHQCFEMGIFLSPKQYQGVAMLYIQGDGAPDLPPFIPVEREVTLDPDFTSSTMAQVDYGVLDTTPSSDSSGDHISLEPSKSYNPVASSPTKQGLVPSMSLRYLRGSKSVEPYSYPETMESPTSPFPFPLTYAMRMQSLCNFSPRNIQRSFPSSLSPATSFAQCQK